MVLAHINDSNMWMELEYEAIDLKSDVVFMVLLFIVFNIFYIYTTYSCLTSCLHSSASIQLKKYSVNNNESHDIIVTSFKIWVHDYTGAIHVGVQIEYTIHFIR